ncbi:hypothetical protein P8A18_16005 [Streptomyces castrisilvae]|uniref:Uncharacterized protein n=1 Tax=Streptomyces castrisilvae TaxID=3033811 RepID=A0ABY9HK00_9ACTN|nr:hypothetical protein [Streptomyces sp. Mut1]WLQ34847.1 hypothetical protein P8A18_16005 [Streptomyces sp. Mut1]
MDDVVRAQESVRAYGELLAVAERLEALRQLGDDGVEAHTTAALHAVRFAATILWRTVPDVPLPAYQQDDERLLELAAHWREAALGLGEFAPQRPVLRLVGDDTPPA